jgi:hypothetical protein
MVSQQKACNFAFWKLRKKARLCSFWKAQVFAVTVTGLLAVKNFYTADFIVRDSASVWHVSGSGGRPVGLGIHRVRALHVQHTPQKV